MENFYDVLFEVSNEDRYKILLQLAETPMNVTQLSKIIGLSLTETSRHLSRLCEVGLTQKEVEGLYNVSSFGKTFLSQLSGTEFISMHREYFNNHSLTCLPLEYIGRLGELNNTVFVDDVMVVFKNIENMMQTAEEYIWRITDRFLMLLLPNILSATKRGVGYKLVYPRDIVFPPDVKLTAELRESRDNGLFSAKSMETSCVFLTMSEKEVAALSFPTLDGRFEYWGFTSTDEQVHRWCKDLFQHYWEKGTPSPYNIW